MHAVRRIVVFALSVMIAAGFASSCKKAAGPEKSMMAKLAGAWTWKEAKAAEPTVLVLELTNKGRYKETTYREVRKQRKLIYFKRLAGDVAVEPDTPEAVAKLKKDGFEPAVEEGAYRLSLGEKADRIIFEKDTLTATDKREGRGVRNVPLILQTNNQLTIGGRRFQR